MLVHVFASGSSGNSLLVSEQNTGLLIDAGISLRRIRQALAQNGLGMQEIGGVLITHEHSDHILSLSALADKMGLSVYAPHTVANRLIGRYPDLVDRLVVVPVGEAFSVGPLRVTAFHTPHDTDESVGYRIEGSGVFALATDMGCVTEEVEAGLRGADTVLIEANHDPELLIAGPYPFPLKRRILSARGHLANGDCAALARRLAESGTKRVILGHLSRENNRPELAMSAVSAALEGLDTELYCAPVLGCLSVPVGKETTCCRSS